MIFTTEQLQNLECDGNEKFKVVDIESLTKKRKREIIEMDEDYYNIFGEHLISNYQQLINVK